MGIYDREYTKSRPGRESGLDWGAILGPRGALMLIGLHLLGFVVALVLRHDAGAKATVTFVLHGSVSHPAAIVLHPIGGGSVLTFVFVVGVIWTLGRRIETRFGTGRLLGLYALGTLIGGSVYFGFAQTAPELAVYPLALPVGGLAAWVLGAWRGLSDETVSIFGRLTTAAKASAIGAVVVAGLVFFWHGPAATAWLIAAAAGSLAWPALNVIRGPVGAPAAPRQGKTQAPRRQAGRNEAGTPAGDAPIDDVLAKISREGLDALTSEERKRLEAARRAKLRQSR